MPGRMRRIGRYILNGLTLVLLLMCVGTCALWVRSDRQADEIRAGNAFGMIFLESSRGRLNIHWYRGVERQPLPNEILP